MTFGPGATTPDDPPAQQGQDHRGPTTPTVSSDSHSSIELIDDRANAAFDRLVRLATAQLSAPAALVALVEGDWMRFRSCTGLPEPWATTRQVPVKESLSGRVALTAHPVVLGDVLGPAAGVIPEQSVAAGIRAFAGIPLATESGEVVGAFAAFDFEPRDWTQHEIDVLRDLAAGAMTEIDLRIRVAQHRRFEEALQLVFSATGAATSGEAFFRALARHLARALRVRYAFVAAVEGSAKARTLAFWRGEDFGENYDYELAGTPCEELLRTSFCQVLSGAAERYPGYAFLRDHGIQCYVGHPILDGQGKAIGILAVMHDQPVRDLSLARSLFQVFGVRAGAELERQRAEEALRASEQRFRSMIENASDPIIILDAGAHILYASDAWLRVFGYGPNENTGRFAFDFIHPDDVERVSGTFEQLLTDPDTSANVEARVRHKSGAWRTLAMVGTNLMHDPAVGGIVVNCRDVTEQRRLEDTLRQIQKMEAVGQLAGGVAHDFNNLLTIIRGHGEMLLESVPAEDPRQEDVREICDAANRAASLTRQLLAFSRKQLLQPRALDLNVVVNSVEPMLRRLIGEDIEIVTSLYPSLGPVMADQGQIEQILMNLAVNARDAMPNGGKVVIETREVELDEDYAGQRPPVVPGTYVLLAVSDTGHGMDRPTQERIFEPFFTTKDPGRGTGLGLSTVYGIVKQSGGYIWVYSELDRGTTFKVYLPRVGGTVEPVQRASSSEDTTGSETILLVEDEDAVGALARRILERQGYVVLHARSGAEALEIAGVYDGRIDLVVTDVVMPQMNGPELAARLAERWPSARVLFMSGYTDDDMIRQGLLRPGMAFLQKPFTMAGLAQAARAALDAAPAGVRAL